MADEFKVEMRGSVEGWTDDLIERVGVAVKGNMLKAAELARGSVDVAIRTSMRDPTGPLQRSYTATLLEPKDGKLRSGALSDLVYARIQDEGGTITPVNAEALTLPISAKAKMMSRNGMSAGDFPGLKLVWPRGWDRGWLEDKKGTLHYSLRKSVRMPGRGYLHEAEKVATPLIVDGMGLDIQKAGDDSKAGGE